MAITSTIQIDGDCDALRQSRASQIITKQHSAKRILSSETKARIVEISDLFCGEYVRFGYEDGKLLEEKIRKLEVENEGLQVQVATMKSNEEAMKERVKEAEHQMQELEGKLKDAEALIIELQKNGQENPRQSRTNLHTEEEKHGLQELLEKLQLMCASHETSTNANDLEDQEETNHLESKRFSSYNEPKLLCWRDDQCAEYDNDLEQVQELQEELKKLSTKLTFSVSHTQTIKEVITAATTKFAEITTADETLRKELHSERMLVQARENIIQNLEIRVEALSTSNQMLKSMLNLKKMALEPRKSLNFTMLEPKLLDLAAIVNAQNSCVVRLSIQNETLARSLQSKMQENELQAAQVTAAVKQKEAAVRALEQFKEQVVGWATEMDDRDLNCDLLQEYVANLETELRCCQSQHNSMLHTYEETRKERDKLLAWQVQARTRIANSEKALDEREKEVESFSREALHMSLEVELLRRKLHQLDEDVMFKEGQISILRGSWEEE